MTSTRKDRYRARQQKLSILREHRGETAQYCVPLPEKENGVTSTYPIHDTLDMFTEAHRSLITAVTTPVSVSSADANALILEIRSRWDHQQMDVLVRSCRNSVLSSVVGPFGLGSFVALLDKDGGPVDTVHNARAGVYATDEEKQKYANLEAYDSALYHKHEDYIAQNRINSDKLAKGTLVDQYSNTVFDPAARKDEQSKPNLDHTYAAANIHADPGRVLADLNGPDLANQKSNLNATNASVNKSKNARTAEEFTEYLDSTADRRELRIHELQQMERTLTDQERKELTKLEKLSQCDPDEVVRAEQRAKADIDQRIDASYYGGKKFLGQLTQTSVKEAGKMGLQQAFGLLLVEFFSASFDEISDAYKHGFRDSLNGERFFDALRARLSRVSSRVAAKWKDALLAFRDGALSGFLSNLVTALINMLFTTAKRTVRVIREGILSIMKAVKVALFPPEGMREGEAADAAMKLIATGTVVSLGLIAEESVEKSIALFLNSTVPLLAPYASTVSAVIVGAMTGIASALVVFGLDSLDIFGVNERKRHEDVMRSLDQLIIECDRNLTSSYNAEMNRHEVILAKLQGQ
jgi:hypothetical protein